MSNFSSSLVTVIGLFVGLAIVATLVSKNASTATVLKAFGDALSSILKAATSPVSS